MDAVNKFLKSFSEVSYHGEYSYQETRPRIECNDGFSISIQACRRSYSKPRLDGDKVFDNGAYIDVELGFPSEEDSLINEYAEGSSDDPPNYVETVYPYTPVTVVNELLEKHGGINEHKMESQRFMDL